ncbi:glycosyltransferase family 4 protein [Aquimarina spongiae]|uniref:Glycosyltransferase involved in cell wall bisynthesis n=1 Tax=Aquimarina spongiae TaxID=570521 RepID=A0A1M6GHA7_9FLAO|nr:glycosyltransferase family 4 protein [Aquimarina spongiae]SHJ09339.1 Glycosyltransferase involved in cell wall bisynthesis [Aquimarina spongiae]
MRSQPKYLYIAFDVFPSTKGAATHINHCLKALQNTFDVGLLICLGTDEMPQFQFDEERSLYVYRWKRKELNFLKRTQFFSEDILKFMKSDLCQDIQLVHFRDIWGGVPAVQSFKNARKIFEINAFPSIELPYRYAKIHKGIIHKIESLENQCVHDSDIIITPSKVTKDYIQKRFSISENKVNLIPNGVTIYESDTTNSTNPYILYFGAIQKWQGLKTLLKAMREVKDLDMRLVMCIAVPEKKALYLKKLAEDIGVENKIDWHFELDKNSLASKIKNALCTIAPLSACNRNLKQGCNPLKIVESMGYGTPVIASDIAVVHEFIDDNNTGFLVPPDRPELLGRKIRTLVQNTSTLKSVGDNAKNYVIRNFLWEFQEKKMKEIYVNGISCI